MNMKTFIHVATRGAFVLLATLSFIACTDKNDWDVDSSYERLFSITKMSVSVNATDANYTFTANAKADYYIIELSKDSLYDAIELGQSESSIVYGEDKSITKSPVNLDDLDSNTKYFLRVKAMSTAGKNSNWAYLDSYYFTTKSEQIISSVTPGIFDVTIEWPANSRVTHVVVLNGSTTVVTQNLTASEIAAGKATIDGLEAKTDYTVRLMNETLLRGSKTFKTLIDTGTAIIIDQGDDIETMLAAAEDGDEFAIMEGTYDVNARISLTKTIAIRAAEPGKAIINGMSFNLSAGAGLELSDLVLNDINASGYQLINYPEAYAASTAALTISGCNISNYASGFINQRFMVEVQSITITDNIFNNIGASGRFIDIQSGYVKTITVKNNTIANSCQGQDVIRIDNAAGGFSNVNSMITFSNNTLYKVGSNSASIRLFYTRLTNHAITASNNLITYSSGIYSNQSATKVTGFANNYYYEAAGYLSGYTVVDTSGTVANPDFKDPANLDFTVQNRAVADAGAGDPRWIE